MDGTFIILVGPSGSGKNTLLTHVEATFPEIHFPLSYVSRDKRPGESEGDPYHFISTDKFETMIQDEAFLEWAEYSGNYYGTARESIVPYLEQGETVMKQMEVQGARIVKSNLPDENLCIIFVDAGPWEVLERRITERSDIDPVELKKRKERYNDEITFKKEADVVVTNQDGKLEAAKETIANAVKYCLRN